MGKGAWHDGDRLLGVRGRWSGGRGGVGASHSAPHVLLFLLPHPRVASGWSPCCYFFFFLHNCARGERAPSPAAWTAVKSGRRAHVTRAVGGGARGGGSARGAHLSDRRATRRPSHAFRRPPRGGGARARRRAGCGWGPSRPGTCCAPPSLRLVRRTVKSAMGSQGRLKATENDDERGKPQYSFPVANPPLPTFPVARPPYGEPTPSRAATE